MVLTKSFKVASISSNANSFGLFGHIMVAEDGETWQVGRNRSGNYPPQWSKGEIVDVPLMSDPVRKIPRPAWEELNCEIPQRMPDAPAAVLAEVWGKPLESQSETSLPPREVEPSIVFTASQFTPTRTQTAQEKADFANAFVKFVENGFCDDHFPDWFYKRLSMTFGHIAHFDRQTFFRTFFGNARDKAIFIERTMTYRPVGDPAFAYSDVERVLQDWLRTTNVPVRVQKTAEHATNRAEREQLRKLLDKHGLPDDFQANDD